MRFFKKHLHIFDDLDIPDYEKLPFQTQFIGDFCKAYPFPHLDTIIECTESALKKEYPDFHSIFRTHRLTQEMS